MTRVTEAFASTSARMPFGSVSAVARGRAAVTRTAPAIDGGSTAIDELAFVLAADNLSALDKIWLLEQWRYDMLQLDIASGEGLASACDEGVLLQQVNKALSLLARCRAHH